MQDSKIEWCDDTVNGWIGCAKVSAGCANCYAENLDSRKLFGGRRNWGVDAERLDRSDKAVAEIARIARRAAKEGEPRFVFLSSMCDLFEDRADVVPWRAKVWAAIQEANADDLRIVALLLTKRPEVMLAWQREVAPQGLPHWAWVGTSVENQEAADARIPVLLEVETDGIRFLSMEPLLGPVDLLCVRWPTGYCDALRGVAFDPHGSPEMGDHPPGIGWVIVGGESGPKARPMHPDWARSLRDQCAGAGVPFLFKQWGEWAPVGPEEVRDCALDHLGRTVLPMAGSAREDFPKGASSADRWVRMYDVGKKDAGRVLDGAEHNGRPPATAAENIAWEVLTGRRDGG